MTSVNNCISVGYKVSPIHEALAFCYRFINEIATCEFEKQGRLITLYGKTKDAANEAENLAKEAGRTLLDNLNFDLNRMIVVFKEFPGAIENVFNHTPLFRERDEERYPKVKPEDVTVVRKKLEAMESLSRNNRAKKTSADLTEFAYIMKDLIFYDLARILGAFQNIANSNRTLMDNPDKRTKLYQLMAKDYQENEWKNDQQYIREELNDYIRQHGYTKESLQTFLKRLELDSLNYARHGDVATINHHYLNQNSHISYIYHSRHQLTQHDIRLHLHFVNSRKMVMQEIELFDLKQPAVGSYSILFKNRAAHQLADLLAPVFSMKVDFEHDYHHIAWVEAMKDTGLIDSKKRNGPQIIHYIENKFGESIDKSSLSRYSRKGTDFGKIKDQYDLILSIINQALGREQKKECDYFQDESSEFFERLETLKKAL